MELKTKQIIRKKHPSTVRGFLYPIARWCPWGKWTEDGRFLMNPVGKIIHPPLKVYGNGRD